MISRNFDSVAIILNTDGQIVAASYPYSESYIGKSISKDLVKELISGKSVQKMIGISLVSSKPVLAVCEPIIYNESLLGTAMILSPEPIINAVKKDILIFAIITFVLSVLIAFILSYITSKKMTKPLNKLCRASEKIANGNFNERVNIESYNEIKQLAGNYNNMAEYLDNLEQMRSSFVANVSHELRTPMTTIGGFVDAIIDDTIPKEKQTEYLEIISSEVKRLSRLITRLLDASKSEYMLNNIVKNKFDFSEMLRQTIIKFEQIINTKNITTFEKNAFFHCDALLNVEFANEVESIGDTAFSQCYSLHGTIDLSNVKSMSLSIKMYRYQLRPG